MSRAKPVFGSTSRIASVGAPLADSPPKAKILPPLAATAM
jgi:hypothetical protein